MINIEYLMISANAEDNDPLAQDAYNFPIDNVFRILFGKTIAPALEARFAYLKSESVTFGNIITECKTLIESEGLYSYNHYVDYTESRIASKVAKYKLAVKKADKNELRKKIEISLKDINLSASRVETPSNCFALSDNLPIVVVAISNQFPNTPLASKFPGLFADIKLKNGVKIYNASSMSKDKR